MENNIKSIATNFSINGNLVNVEENNQGNINKTYILTYEDEGVKTKYLLQKINSNVFKQPYVVMRNIDLITSHIQYKLDNGIDTLHKTMGIVYTNKGDYLYTQTNSYGEKEYYRVVKYIDHCVSYDNLKQANNPVALAYEAGKNLGAFQRLVSDAPISMLTETIKDFHNTPKRFNDLLESIENQITDRAKEFAPEIIDLISKIKECSLISYSLGRTLPYRVTHNDPKLNNMLLDKTTGQGVALIDLDTVMPGSLLFDVGDGIRSACSTAFENETDLTKISLDMELAKSYLKGYLEEMYAHLTDEEINYLGLSVKVLTYELALRFLTDYINGDTYFKIKYPTHNKDRFINQYTLLKDIEKKLPELNMFIKDTITKLRGNTRKLTQNNS